MKICAFCMGDLAWSAAHMLARFSRIDDYLIDGDFVWTCKDLGIYKQTFSFGQDLQVSDTFAGRPDRFVRFLEDIHGKLQVEFTINSVPHCTGYAVTTAYGLQVCAMHLNRALEAGRNARPDARWPHV